MKLPNAHGAQVAHEKIEGYLLSESHPVGRAKARSFRSLGFRREDAQALRLELLHIAREGEAAEIEAPFGPKYVVDGVVHGRFGAARVRTIWIMEPQGPRFVTAYPA